MTQNRIFLSHADKDKDIAAKIADELKQHFNVFLAHRDIEPGSDWEIILKERIEECDLFMVLLSHNFKNAEYTNQEVGIAICLKKKIYPCSIDDIMPYGFMSKYQSTKLDIEDIKDSTKKLSEDFERAVDWTGTIRETDELITELIYAKSFVEANKIASELSKRPNFTDGQLRNIAKAYNQNFEVRNSWTAGPFVLELLKRTGKTEFLDDKWKKFL